MLKFSSKKLSIRSKKIIFRRWRKYNMKFTFFYCRSILHNLFCTRLIRIKSFIEGYSYKIFKQPVSVQLFVMSHNVPLLKKKRYHYSNLYSRKLNLLDKIPYYTRNFDVFNFFLNKKYLNYYNNNFYSAYTKNIFFSVFSLKINDYMLHQQNSFINVEDLNNFYYKHVIFLMKKYPLLKLDSSFYYADNCLRKKIIRARASYNDLSVSNKKFDFLFYLLHSFNRTSLKYLISRLLQKAVSETAVMYFSSDELSDQEKTKLNKQILNITAKIYSINFVNWFLIKNYLKGIVIVHKKVSEIYSEINNLSDAHLKKMLITKKNAFLKHNNALKTLNIFNLIHISPKDFLKTSDYFIKRRTMRVSIEKHANLKKNLKLMLFGLYFGNASLFNEAFCKSLEKLRKHRKFLIFYEKKLIEMFYNVNLKTDIAGIHMRIRGKHEGKIRRSTYWIRLGEPIKEQKFFKKLNYNFRSVTTFTGVFGISTWFVYVKSANVNSRENKI